jgi:outer membrane protein TolC
MSLCSRAFQSCTVLAAACTVSASAARGQDTLRLSLADALARAVRESDEIQLARSQLDLADAQVTTARAAGLPQLRFSGSYSQVIRNARAEIVSGQIFGQAFTYTTNVNVSQTLFQGGRVFAGSRAAADVRRAARFSLDEVRSQLAVDAQRAYLSAVLARELENVQRRNVALAAERAALVERLQSGGRASRFDVLRARVERVNLEPALLQAATAREVADIELRRLLNLSTDRPLDLTSQLDTAALLAVVQTVKADTGREPTRASERAAEYSLEARRQSVRAARADFLPTVSTFFQTGFTALPTSNGIPTIRGDRASSYCAPGSPPDRVCQNNGWFTDRNFGLQVQWPLFDGLRAKGSVDLAQAQERVARLLLVQTREQIGAERARARAELARAEASYHAQRQNVAEAEEAFRIASLRFERGLGTQLEVSDAQLLLLTASTNAARATTDYYLAAAELARARGLEIPLPPTRDSR